MRKRILSLILSALLLSALCIPCTAEAPAIQKQQGCHAFSDIPATMSPYYQPVKTCYEFGWMDPVDEDRFGIYEPLTKAEMVALLARLYSVLNGRDGTIPDIPEDLGDFIRFYDTGGNLVHNVRTAYCPDFIRGDDKVTVIFRSEELLQERLTMEIGFPGDGTACSAPGVRRSFDPTEKDTAYVFTLPEGAGAWLPDLEDYQKTSLAWQNTWKLNEQENLNDPTPYAAVLYLLYREPAKLPLCFRTSFLDTDPNGKVWRAEFAVPLSSLCGGLPEINTDVSAPDLPGEWEGDILALYRKGILRGFDGAGTFGGREWLTRGQAALIAIRVLNAVQG